METPSTNYLSAADLEQIYDPAEDSFLLLDALEKDMRFLKELRPSLVVEIGVGSGVILTALAKLLHSNAFCLGIDISRRACEVARLTAELNGASIETVNMDLVGGLRSGSVDLLVFNPPYVPSEEGEISSGVAEESLVRTWAGGKNGAEIVWRLLHTLPDLLSEKGVFYLLLLRENDPAKVSEELTGKGFVSEVWMERKIPGEHLFVLKIVRKPIVA